MKVTEEEARKKRCPMPVTQHMYMCVGKHCMIFIEAGNEFRTDEGTSVPVFECGILRRGLRCQP